MNKLVLFLIILLCLGACVPGHNDYSEYHNIASDGWRYSDVHTFNISHSDSIANGQLALALRHTDAYLYSNVWIEVKYEDIITGSHTDTLNITLADKMGRWLGKGNATDIQIINIVTPNLTHRSGSPVKVRHIMRVDSLTGINLLGMTFNANQPIEQ